MATIKLAMIGIGNMGEAILAGLLDSGAATPDSVWGSEKINARAAEIAERYSVAAGLSVEEACSRADVILLAVKPQDVDQVIAQIAPVSAGKLLISICAGISTGRMRGFMPEASIVRVMPNTPALIREGASAYYKRPEVTCCQTRMVETILSTIGDCREVPKEELMDAVTGLSGSGPAYVYLFIEALTEGGVRNGLPRDLALELAVQTVVGAAKMVKETGEHTGVLKDRVTSPGGTTIAGLGALESGGFKSLVMDAVSAATKRSKELGG